ncbi:MAG: BrnT family toxin [Terriglobales bacterium]
MTPLVFSWDAKKDHANQRKHGVSFEEAKSVFYDENAKLIPDPDHSDEEDRFILLGWSSAPRMLLVCHCYRSNDRVIRIISARKATKREREQNGEGRT